jgi:hypothetical protein
MPYSQYHTAIPYRHISWKQREKHASPLAGVESGYNRAKRYIMPVMHDVDAFSGEWHRKSHK